MTARLDIRGTPCPLNLVKVRLALETLAAGEDLEVLLDAGESLDNVPRAAREAGHHVLVTEPGDPARLLIRKGERPCP